MKLSGFVPFLHNGVLFLRVSTSPEVASFFEESIVGTIEAIELHLRSLNVNDSVGYNSNNPAIIESPVRLYCLWEVLEKAPGFSNIYALVLAVWGCRCPDPTFQRAHTFSSNDSSHMINSFAATRQSPREQLHSS